MNLWERILILERLISCSSILIGELGIKRFIFLYPSRLQGQNTGQHIPYRENRHLVGTARYASINAHLGIEQSRRDDIESIGYVLVYLILGRLPWQSKQEKGKQPAKIMEKKLITPPEILCKKLPLEFSYYFHYCKNLKYEDRPDYATLKSLFYDLLMQQENVSVGFPEFTLDWFEDDNVEYRRDEDGILISITNVNKNSDDVVVVSLIFSFFKKNTPFNFLIQFFTSIF